MALWPLACLLGICCVTGQADESCTNNIDGGGWKLVRHTYNKWFDANDGMTGTASYGEVTGPMSQSEFAIAFDAEDDTEFMFSFGCFDKWLITTYDQFAYRKGSNYDAQILKSHISDEPYIAKWYNRGNSEDPWISYKDHWDESRGTQLYSESNNGYNPCWPGQYINVWMRVEADPTSPPSVTPTTSPSAEPTAEPTQSPTKDCSALHIDEFLVDCSIEFDGHGDRIESLESGGSAMMDTVTGHSQNIATLKAAVSDLENATTTMSAAINAHGVRIDSIETEGSTMAAELTQHGQDIRDLKATVSGLANTTATLTAAATSIDADLQRIMEHLDILGDYQTESGMTPIVPMPLDTSDYALYALAATNLIVVMCLAVYCVFVRATTPKYSKVAMYATETEA